MKPEDGALEPSSSRARGERGTAAMVFVVSGLCATVAEGTRADREEAFWPGELVLLLRPLPILGRFVAAAESPRERAAPATANGA